MPRRGQPAGMPLGASPEGQQRFSPSREAAPFLRAVAGVESLAAGSTTSTDNSGSDDCTADCI